MEQEGVTKFDLRFTPAAVCPFAWIGTLNVWRTRLHELRLIGQEPGRYGGIGFGNVSCRAPPGTRGLFLVSGTQTGHLPVLGAPHYCLVTHADVAANRLEAEGPVAPSSESLTHAMLYALAPSIACVLHVHSPDIWRAAGRLGLPATPANVPYGTPAMAEAVAGLLQGGRLSDGLFVMAGHEDGVVVLGDSVEAAGRTLVSVLERAKTLPLS